MQVTEMLEKSSWSTRREFLALELVDGAAKNGFPSPDANRSGVSFHLCISSCVADSYKKKYAFLKTRHQYVISLAKVHGEEGSGTIRKYDVENK